VKYTYEKLYPFESQDKFRKRYRPDFYLDDYDFYLEHFGITEDNRTPWLSEVEETKYIDSMEWKRDFHLENETMLLETYSYYNKSGILLTKLDEILRSHGVVYKKVDYAEIYDKLFSEREDKYFGEFKKLIQTFIELFKSRGYSEANFEAMREKAKRLNSNFEKNRTLLFLSIVRPIYTSYQKMLRDDGYIDFNDMINLATDLVRNGKTDIKLKYIIIDEYQDISVSRFNLIKEIKKVTNAKVVAVGDDWQSIFRFAGSDIALFTSFDKYLGYSAILRLEKTYRNCQELLNIAEKFVTRNPYQMKKHLSSDKHHSNPIRILGYSQNIGLALQKAIDEIVYLFGENTEIKILGRHNFDIDILKDYPGFAIRKTSNNTRNIHYSRYKDLRLTYRTVHSSKGTEADNVIIINLENELLGFPNKISDDPLLLLVLTDLDSFNYAEERRLFYVAITRTKNLTYLIVPDKNQSIFVKELIESFGIRYSIATGEVSIHENPRCSKCQEGYLMLRENTTDGSKFLGCTNYPHCENRIRHIEILDNYIKCNSCGGYMVRRNGKHGEFYGCTNYPFCVNTINIERKTKYH
jgi:DNA helicase-4